MARAAVHFLLFHEHCSCVKTMYFEPWKSRKHFVRFVLLFEKKNLVFEQVFSTVFSDVSLKLTVGSQANFQLKLCNACRFH